MPAGVLSNRTAHPHVPRARARGTCIVTATAASLAGRRAILSVCGFRHSLLSLSSRCWVRAGVRRHGPVPLHHALTPLRAA